MQKGPCVSARGRGRFKRNAFPIIAPKKKKGERERKTRLRQWGAQCGGKASPEIEDSPEGALGGFGNLTKTFTSRTVKGDRYEQKHVQKKKRFVGGTTKKKKDETRPQFVWQAPSWPFLGKKTVAKKKKTTPP